MLNQTSLRFSHEPQVWVRWTMNPRIRGEPGLLLFVSLGVAQLSMTSCKLDLGVCASHGA